MKKVLIAKVPVRINVPISKVWLALINPEMIRQYMFGTEAVSEWKEGSPIIWKSVWKDKPYEDKGIILKNELGKMLKYSHFSPLSGFPDVPVNFRTLTYDLSDEGDYSLCRT